MSRLIGCLLFFEVLLGFSNAQQCNSDILFILDSSGSVEEDFYLMEKYIKEVSKLLSIFPGGHRVALIQYSGKWQTPISLRFDEVQSNAEFQKRLNNLRYLRGTTFTGRALNVALDILSERRNDALTVVLVITDGFHHDPEDVVRLAKKIQQMSNLEMFCAAVPSIFSLQGMLEVAGDPTHMLYPPNLVEKTQQILLPIGCTRDAPIPTTTLANTTSTTIPTTTVYEYKVSGCEVDLLLIVDFSSSVRHILDQYLIFVKSLIKSMRIGKDYTRVAFIKYSSKTRTQSVFHFNKYFTQEEMLAAIDHLQRMGGLTDTNWALEMGTMEYSLPDAGARPGLARWVAVLFTDGYSQKDPKPGAEKLRSIGVELYAVGVTSDRFRLNMKELEVIVGNEWNVYTQENFDQLESGIKSIRTACGDGKIKV